MLPTLVIAFLPRTIESIPVGTVIYQNRVDITDIVKQLDAHDRNVGNPEDIINAMIGIDDKYKNKAISLLQNALN